MISKSLRNVTMRKGMPAASLINTPQRRMGGGEKKPNMPLTETNYDVVFVGKYLALINYSLLLQVVSMQPL